MKLKVSVIICTHNPSYEYFTRVVDSLENQTINKDSWELLVIDNASTNDNFKQIHFDWHPKYRYIYEEQIGLTLARLRGIKESKANLLIFVDDDNVLDPEYLEIALRISNEYPVLGAWGGQTIPEFEINPPEWTRPYWLALAIRGFKEDKWSNLANQYETTPCGAGMCIRKDVAEKYAELALNDPIRISMGRKGDSLTSYEDSDMAFTACDMGYGIGRFSSLKLKHLIPRERLEEDYLLKLVESSTHSAVIVESYRGKFPSLNKSCQSKLADWYRYWRMSSRERRFYNARMRGIKSAIQELCKNKTGKKYFDN